MEAPDTAVAYTHRKVSLKETPELVMARHRDIERATLMHSPTFIAAFLRDTLRLRRRAVAKFWSGENSYNAYVMRRFSKTKDDLDQDVQIWTIGYLAYRCPTSMIYTKKQKLDLVRIFDLYTCDPKGVEDLDHIVEAKLAAMPAVEVDGRLERFLGQRFVEYIRSIQKKVQDCSPEVEDHQLEEFQQASMSQSSQDLEVLDSKPKAKPKGPISSRLLLLERLAVKPHQEAALIYLSNEEGEGPDGRSQAARLTKEMRDCSAWGLEAATLSPGYLGPTRLAAPGPVGTGTCSICSVRRREPDGAVLEIPRRTPSADVRTWLEEHLGLTRGFSRIQTHINMRTPGKTYLGERYFRQCQLAAHVLGLVALNSNGSLSATSNGYALLNTEPGYEDELGVLSALLATSPTALALKNTSFLDLGDPMARKKPVIAPVTAVTTPTQSTAFPAFRVLQNGHMFFIASVPVDDLFPSCFVDRSGDNETGFQRNLTEGRAENIGAHLAQEGNSIPGVVVLSATDAANLTFDGAHGTVSFMRRRDAFSVIDGQHRLWGYQKCKTRHSVPVAIYVALSQAAEARLFLTINDEQVGVPRALLLQVKGVAGLESPAEADLRGLFRRLSTEATSPLKGLLVVGSVAKGKLTRSSFDYAVSRAHKSDSYAGLPTEKRYELVSNYVRAFQTALTDKDRLWRRYYFAAMFDLFDEVVKAAKKRHGSAKLESLEKVVRTIANVPGVLQRDFIENMRRGLSAETSVSSEDV